MSRRSGDHLRKLAPGFTEVSERAEGGSMELKPPRIPSSVKTPQGDSIIKLRPILRWGGVLVGNVSERLGIRRLHAGGDVAIAVIDLVDLLEAIERGDFVTHLGVDEAFFVEDFLLGIVHGDEVGEGV